MKRKNQRALDEFHAKGYGRLARFNAERARGIVHTDDYAAEMAEIQRRFDEEQLAEAERAGAIIVGASA